MAKKTDAPETEATAVSPVEAEYTVSEFAANAKKLFGDRANADLVNAAFMVNGKGKATIPQAKAMVSEFMSKEVK